MTDGCKRVAETRRAGRRCRTAGRARLTPSPGLVERRDPTILLAELARTSGTQNHGLVSIPGTDGTPISWDSCTLRLVGEMERNGAQKYSHPAGGNRNVCALDAADAH